MSNLSTGLGPGDNLILCWVTSASAGLGAGFFSCVLSASDKMKQSTGGKYTKRSLTYLVAGIVGSTIFGMGSLVGLFFGPITTVTVVRAGTTLPANALFSQLLGLRPLVRDDYLGTLSCICGVVCFASFQGVPPPLTNELFMADFLRPISMAWNAGLLVLMLLSVFALTCMEANAPGLRRIVQSPCGGINHTFKAMMVSVLIACSSSIMDVSGKCWLAVLQKANGSPWTGATATFWIAFITNALFLVIMRVGTIYGCAKCDILLFVPINTMLNCVLSVATGIVVLDEGSQVYSWVGLSFSIISLVGGVLMLVTGPADSAEIAAQDGEEVMLEGPTRSFLSTATRMSARSAPLIFQTHRNGGMALRRGIWSFPGYGLTFSRSAAARGGALSSTLISYPPPVPTPLQSSDSLTGALGPLPLPPAQTQQPSHPQTQPQPRLHTGLADRPGLTDLSLPLCEDTDGGRTPVVPAIAGFDAPVETSQQMDEALSCITWVMVHEALLRMNNCHQQAAQFRSHHQKEWDLMRQAMRNVREVTQETGLGAGMGPFPLRSVSEGDASTTASATASAVMGFDFSSMSSCSMDRFSQSTLAAASWDSGSASPSTRAGVKASDSALVDEDGSSEADMARKLGKDVVAKLQEQLLPGDSLV